MTNEQHKTEHPGDAYARREIDAWYQQHLQWAQRDLERATAAAAAALAGHGDKTEAQHALDAARKQQAEYEAGFEQWTSTGTMPWRHSETVSGVIGSIDGGLDAAFGPPVQITEGEQAALELGLDPDLEPGTDSGPSDYQNASREYRARWAVAQDAMERMGLYRAGDPPTAEMHAEFAADMAAEDAWRVSVGLPPMWDDAIQEERAAAGPEALAAYAANHPETTAPAEAEAPAADPDRAGNLADTLAAGRQAVAAVAARQAEASAEDREPEIHAEPVIERSAPEPVIDTDIHPTESE
jgi:hypothetical protein